MTSTLVAAIDVIDAEGVDALSVRRLARELNYSRSGIAYRIGSMADLEAEVFVAVAADLGRSVVGDRPYRPDDPAWLRASACRVFDWLERYPNRASFLMRTRLPPEAWCPIVGKVLDDVLEPGHNVERASVNYLVSAFAVTVEIKRLFADREQALDAIVAHSTSTWRTLVLAARQPSVA